MEYSCISPSQNTGKALADDLEISLIALNREKVSIFIPRGKNLKKLALGSYKHLRIKQYLPTLE